jgi:ribonuclease-3
VHAGLQALQSRLQHVFSDPSLLQRATTHRSFSADHNERLEFLGDSVLNLAVASLLYQRLSALPEGDLSRVRANLVKQDTLHQLALGLKVSEVLRLGEGESKSGGQQRPSILADALEALIGAVYLDAGYGSAEALVHRLFQGVEINPQMQAASKDAKTFDVECDIPELGLTERGIGGSRRAGEQAAAVAMLATLKAKNL